MEFFLITIIIAAALFYFLMLLYRLTVDTILEKYRATGGNILRCLIIGNNNQVSQLYDEILKFPELGYRADGVYTYNSKSKLNSVPHLGKFADLDEIAIKNMTEYFFLKKSNLKLRKK
jgi:FlaA1/EpsC-like NDP-sugar epimerase